MGRQERVERESLVGGPCAIAERGEERELVAPRHAEFREPVQAERQLIPNACCVHVEVETIGAHAL
jgi:hypothetical protein